MRQRGFHGVLTEPAQNRHVNQALLRRNTAVPRENVSHGRDVQLRLVVAQQHRGPQLLPRLALQQAVRVLDLEPHAREQQHGVLERARGGPLSEAAIAHDVQQRGDDGAVGCADDEGGEGGGAAGVVVDGLVFEDAGEDVEGLGGQEDSDGAADADVGEDGGEGHDVGGEVAGLEL